MSTQAQPAPRRRTPLADIDVSSEVSARKLDRALPATSDRARTATFNSAL